MAYIIEGTVSELTVEGNSCIFKINGSEGYSLKIGKEKHNVLHSVKAATNENVISAYILFSDRSYSIPEIELPILASALSCGKRVKVIIEANDNDIKNGVDMLKVSSITLLAN